MKKFTSKIALIVAVIFFSLSAKSQNHGTSLNARAGITTYGISARHFINTVSAVDGLVTIDPNLKRYLLTALYEEQYQFGNVNGLSWFVGVGMHGGFVKHDEIITAVIVVLLLLTVNLILLLLTVIV